MGQGERREEAELKQMAPSPIHSSHFYFGVRGWVGEGTEIGDCDVGEDKTRQGKTERV